MGRSETGRTGARFGAPARRAEHTPDPPYPHGHRPDEPGPVDVATPPVPAQGDEVTLPTGARFGGHARQKRKRAEKSAARSEPVATPSAPDPRPPGMPAGPPSELGREWETRPMPRFVDDPAPDRAGTRSVRPYVMTGGRTRARTELRIETLVSCTGGPGGPIGSGSTEGPCDDVGERRSVLELCRRPRSVSEVAALAEVPLGVARVLIDDLATEGRLRVHVGVDAATGPDLALLDRVLSGLRRL